VNLDCADHIGRSRRQAGSQKRPLRRSQVAPKPEKLFCSCSASSSANIAVAAPGVHPANAARRIAANNLRSCRSYARVSLQAGIYFPVAVFVKAHGGSQGGTVVAISPAKMRIGIAAVAAATLFGTSSSRAYGDAPWCVRKNPKRRRVLELPISHGGRMRPERGRR
jgi:hypothetical protein